MLRVADDIPHPEDRAVGVVDHVKVAVFDVIVGDGRKEVPSRWEDTGRTLHPVAALALITFRLTWCS